jgi:integrase
VGLDVVNINSRNFRSIMASAELGEWELDDEGKRKRFRPAHRVYDLRHTCATLLLRAGENPKVVSERLGHASIVLTLDTYSHVLPDMQVGAVEKLNAMFGEG